MKITIILLLFTLSAHGQTCDRRYTPQNDGTCIAVWTMQAWCLFRSRTVRGDKIVSESRIKIPGCKPVGYTGDDTYDPDWDIGTISAPQGPFAGTAKDDPKPTPFCDTLKYGDTSECVMRKGQWQEIIKDNISLSDTNVQNQNLLHDSLVALGECLQIEKKKP